MSDSDPGVDAPTAFDANDDSEISLEQARKMIDAQTSDESADAPAETELKGETPDNSDPEADPAEQKEETEPEEPAIEPPNSWTKAEKERFASLPRETQEYLHTREQERERAVRAEVALEAAERRLVEWTTRVNHLECRVVELLSEGDKK